MSPLLHDEHTHLPVDGLQVQPVLQAQPSIPELGREWTKPPAHPGPPEPLDQFNPAIAGEHGRCQPERQP